MDLNGLVSIAMAGGRPPVTRSTLVDKTYIAEDPHALAAQAGISDDVYALARMSKSEGSGMRDPKADIMVKIATAQTCVAVARRKGISVFDLLTHNGRYGRQGVWVNYAATSVVPTPLEIAIAQAVLADTVPDVAKNGTHFLSPWGPGATQAGKVLPDFETTIRNWAKNEGAEWVGHIPGVDSFRFMAFRQTNPVSALAKVPAAMDVVNRGLRGDHAPAPWDISAIAVAGGSMLAILGLFGAFGLLLYKRFYGNS